MAPHCQKKLLGRASNSIFYFGGGGGMNGWCTEEVNNAVCFVLLLWIEMEYGNNKVDWRRDGERGSAWSAFTRHFQIKWKFNYV